MKPQKTNLIRFIILYFTIILLFFTLSYNFFINNFKKTEEKQNNSNIYTILTTISKDLQNINNTTNDYAQWDETYKFIETQNPDYIYENFREGTNTLEDLNIDFIIYTTRKNKVLFSKYVKDMPIANSKRFETYIINTLQHRTISTIFKYKSQLLYLVKYEIKKSDSSSNSNGFVLSGKFITKEELLSSTKAFDTLNIINKESDSSLQLFTVPLLQESKVEVHYTKNTIHNNIQLFNYLGDYVASISTQNKRDIVNNGEKTVYTFNILICISLFFIFYILYRNQAVLEHTIQEKSKEIIKQQKIIAQQSKMGAIDEMLENIAHQWRQPLSVISSATTGLIFRKKTDTLNDELFDSSMATINRTTQYLSHTIDDLKNYFQSNKRETTFDLHVTIENALLLVESLLISHHINVTKKIEEVQIHAVENELTQVFLNIINNAIDALKDRETLPEKHLTITVTKDKTHINVVISDNGGGIDTKIIDRIFEPYFTTKHQAQGTGLGLYMSYEIITKHMNGELVAKNITPVINNQTYQGAEFTITLPLKV